MNDLSTKKCVPCEGGVDPLPPTRAKGLLQQLDPKWQLDSNHHQLERTFDFANFHENDGLCQCGGLGRHARRSPPDMTVGYSKVSIVYTTHAIDGLSENDFICAAKIDRLEG